MKELKDYLHLYLGCEVKHQSFVKPLILKSVSVTGIRVGGSDGGNDSYNTLIENIKPILRPLSDMTKEEAVGLISILFSDPSIDEIDHDEIQISLIQGDGGNMVDGDIVIVMEVSCRCFDGQLAIRKCGSMFLYDIDGELQKLSNVPAALNYLRSKQFDCDQLIESGLAIQKP